MLNFVFFTACTCGQRQYSTLFGYSRVKPCEINAVYDAAGTFGAQTDKFLLLHNTFQILPILTVCLLPN